MLSPLTSEHESITEPAPKPGFKKFRIVLIKPSKYADDGYVIRFWKGVLPSNTLNVLHGLTETVKSNRVFGDLKLEIVTFDETAERLPVRRIIRWSRRPSTKLVVGLVGVQTNQFPRAYDLARQFAVAGATSGRRLYASANWRKLRREELGIYREADGVYLCSAEDELRLLDQIPEARTAVIPNAADVDYYQPRPTDPPPDGRTVVYFGLLSTVPNIDAVIHFVQDIWPRIAKANPEARCKIIGGRPPPLLLALAGPRVELTGFVPDLRPHLAAAAAVVVPLRLGGGTRLKIVEAMAMGKAIVSTTLGAEGIETVPGRDILIEDQPVAFADAVNRLLAEPSLAARIGQSARQLAVERYAWSAAAQALEGFYRRILEVGS